MRAERAALIAGSHPVAEAADGADEPGLGGVVAQLAPQVADVDVDQVLVADPLGPPDGVDELAAAERHPRSLRQRGQQVELGAGQRHRLTVDPDVPSDRVDGQRPERSQLRLSGRSVRARVRGSAQHAPATRAISSRGLNGLVM